MVFKRLSKSRARFDDFKSEPLNYFAEVEQGEDLYIIMGEAEKARLADNITVGNSRVSNRETF